MYDKCQKSLMYPAFNNYQEIIKHGPVSHDLVENSSSMGSRNMGDIDG